jgi:hypothetical protein
MPESGAFRFGMEHRFLQNKLLIPRLIFQLTVHGGAADLKIRTQLVQKGCNKRRRSRPFSDSIRVAFADRLYVHASQLFDDRAVGPIIAVAMIGKVRERIAHFGQFGNTPVEIRHMLESDRFDFRTGARPVMPQREQSPDIVDQEAKAPRLPDKAQRMNLLRPINAVAGRGPRGGCEQTDTFVVANHLRRDTRRAGRFTNVHHTAPRSLPFRPMLHLPIIGRSSLGNKDRRA